MGGWPLGGKSYSVFGAVCCKNMDRGQGRRPVHVVHVPVIHVRSPITFSEVGKRLQFAPP
jgi:hypothetical protein